MAPMREPSAGSSSPDDRPRLLSQAATGPIQFLQKLLGLDQTISLGLLSSAWTAVTGPISLALISTYFSPDVQGFYYAFGSILTLQMFLDLGLSNVLLQFASHEWGHLKFEEGDLSGEPAALSRLASLMRFAFLWYGVAAVVLVLVIGPAGRWFFSTSPHRAVAWRGPWLALCAMFGLQMIVDAFFNLLNGCGQIEKTYACNLFNAIASTAVSWGVIVMGGQLWTSPIRAGVCILASGAFAVWNYGAFLRLILRPKSAHSIGWYEDILPFQLKLALTALAGYFSWNLFTPVIFRYWGAAAGGRMGMSWSIILHISMAANLWFSTKVPGFGALIARRDYAGLDRLLLVSGLRLMGLLVLGYFSLLVFIYALNVSHHPWAARLLPLHTVAILEAGMLAAFSQMPLAAYLRAHKKEPVLLVNIVFGLLIAPTTYVLGRHYGPDGVGLGFLALNILSAPWVISIWQRCRRRWHDPASDPAQWREIYV